MIHPHVFKRRKYGGHSCGKAVNGDFMALIEIDGHFKNLFPRPVLNIIYMYFYYIHLTHN